MLAGRIFAEALHQTEKFHIYFQLLGMCFTFCKIFFSIFMETIQWFFFYRLLIWEITLINCQIFNQPLILNIELLDHHGRQTLRQPPDSYLLVFKLLCNLLPLMNGDLLLTNKMLQRGWDIHDHVSMIM